MKKCVNCGAELQDDVNLCNFCGNACDGEAVASEGCEAVSVKAKKPNKKTFIIATIALLLVVGIVIACFAVFANPEKRLYDKGLQLIAQMKDIAESDDYLAMTGYSSMTEYPLYTDIIRQCDYSTPDSVYKITIDFESYIKEHEYENYYDLSKNLKNNLEARLYKTIWNLTSVADSKMWSTTTNDTIGVSTCENVKISESFAFLYYYEDGISAIVSFIPRNGGTCLVNAYFVYDIDLVIDSADDLEDTLNDNTRGIEYIVNDFN